MQQGCKASPKGFTARFLPNKCSDLLCPDITLSAPILGLKMGFQTMRATAHTGPWSMARSRTFASTYDQPRVTEGHRRSPKEVAFCTQLFFEFLWYIVVKNVGFGAQLPGFEAKLLNL